MEEIERISMTLPKDLLNEIDLVIKNLGYSSRSEAIRDAIFGFITEYKATKAIKGEMAGVITLIYNHDQVGLLNKLTEVQHFARDVIESSLHIHLDEERCLEVIVARGKAERIRTIVEKLIGLKGVSQVKLTVAS
ncbi:MAG: nickel-responsive transcriptional regulator NikR [Euryarchaeota archaeon]|nr:nickel-responsive transcriptional regulator NikR [Euryarchaeota archaeon]